MYLHVSPLLPYARLLISNVIASSRRVSSRSVAHAARLIAPFIARTQPLYSIATPNTPTASATAPPIAFVTAAPVGVLVLRSVVGALPPGVVVTPAPLPVVCAAESPPVVVGLLPLPAPAVEERYFVHVPVSEYGAVGSAPWVGVLVLCFSILQTKKNPSRKDRGGWKGDRKKSTHNNITAILPFTHRPIRTTSLIDQIIATPRLANRPRTEMKQRVRALAARVAALLRAARHAPVVG